MGKRTSINNALGLASNLSAIIVLCAVGVAAMHLKSVGAQAHKTQDALITVRYTDIRQSAGITFRQDSTVMEPLPTSLPRPVLRMKASGPPAQDGLTTTRMVGSISW